MAILPILEVPDPRLKTVSTPVTLFDDALKTLVDDDFADVKHHIFFDQLSSHIRTPSKTVTSFYH